LSRDVELHVCDSGSGIPAAHVAQIFEPFYTTEAEGTSLGLYIVEEIMTAHGGSVRIESHEG